MWHVPVFHRKSFGLQASRASQQSRHQQTDFYWGPERDERERLRLRTERDERERLRLRTREGWEGAINTLREWEQRPAACWHLPLCLWAAQALLLLELDTADQPALTLGLCYKILTTKLFISRCSSYSQSGGQHSQSRPDWPFRYSPNLTDTANTLKVVMLQNYICKW